MTMKQKNTDMTMITMTMITMTMITMMMITMAMKQRRNMITTRVRIAALFPGRPPLALVFDNTERKSLGKFVT